MKIQRYVAGQGNCFSDCPNQEVLEDDAGDLVYAGDLKELVGCLEECKAFAIQMEWLSESGEIKEDSPGWVSLLAHVLPDNISSR